LSIILFGQYPRSEVLVKATRDFDRKRISKDVLESALKEDRSSLKNLQKGFSHFTPGLFHWEDLMRPYTELIENCQAGPLTRFFETNTFWRRLEVDGAFRIREDFLDEWSRKYFYPNDTYSAKDPMVFTLPFLFLFRSFSKGMHLDDIQKLLESIVTEIDKKYRGMVVFFEPNIGWKALEEADKKQARDFLDRIKSNTSIPLSLVQCFCSVENEKEFLYSLPVDSIGVDFYCNRLKDIGENFPENKTLLAGVISTESTSLEQKEHIIQFVEGVKKFLPDNNVSFTTSGPAELLPREVMDKKLDHMKEVAQWL